MSMPVQPAPSLYPRIPRSVALAATLTAALALASGAPALAQPSVHTLPNGPFRSIDGTGNNLAHPTWGAAGGDLLRRLPVGYGDAISTLGGAARPSARAISNAVVAQPNVPGQRGISNYIWIWGQFIDHDLDLTPTSSIAVAPFCGEVANVPVPLADPIFDPLHTGTSVIHFCRSVFDPATGTTAANPRQQTTVITSFIDASNVYGSDPVRAAALRKNDGSGELKTSVSDDGEVLLPHNTDGLPNGGDPRPTLFVAGDQRANENNALTAIHTLFLREHNYWARQIRAEAKGRMSDDDVYNRARAIVGAELQAITYNQFLPALLGPRAIPPYRGYRPDVNPGIETMFSTASYRFGHSMLSHFLNRLGHDLRPLPQGPITLQDAFFDPTPVQQLGVDVLLRGAAHQQANRNDCFLVDDVRNFLINDPMAGAFDLASLNIQRGRDNGLPSYNASRVGFGLAPKASFAEINPSDPLVAQRLSSVYASINDVDPWLGGICEQQVRGGIVGELVKTVLADQFTRTRDGDRFYYENIYPPQWVNYFNHLSLSDVIERNTSIDKHEIQDNPFLLGDHDHDHDHEHDG
jgi:peroxidase